MTYLVFMTEEPSMERVLKIIVPKIIPNTVKFQVVPHEGKSDLENSIPKKLRAWRDNDNCKYKFIIIRDQDSGNCTTVKNNLRSLCSCAGRPDSLVRIACHELESWFLGDLSAVETALGGNVARLQNKRKFRDPDNLANPSEEISKLYDDYSKIKNAEDIAPHLNLDNNRSRSFNVFINGLKNFIT